MQQTHEKRKRKRAANFSEEEKLRFLRVLQQKGHTIISKVTSHDIRTNKLKEEEWEVICRDLNSSGTVIRTIDTLKKLWQKLKSDAKVYKSVDRQQVVGTGGGPSIRMENPVLELVVEMTGRGSSGISAVSDCDSDLVTEFVIKEEDDESKALSECDEQSSPPPTPPAAAAQVPLFESSNILERRHMVKKMIELPTLNFDENQSTSDEQVAPIFNQKATNLKRRRSQLDDTSERPRSQNYNKSFASERLRSERAKIDLIRLKIEQETEMHKLKLENERRLYLLKANILERILQKVEDGDYIDANIIKVAFSSTGEIEK